MKIGSIIAKLRNEAKLTQAQFAEVFKVSQQSVQKWESGLSTPDLEKIISISKYFDVSLDALILGNDNRVVEEIGKKRALKPQYQNIHDWEFYSTDLMLEYQQSVDEGLDIERYKEVFSAISMLPKGEIKQKLGDVLFEIVISAKQKEGYKYVEPSELEKIKSLKRGTGAILPYDKKALKDKIHGAWLGRVCGCYLGKTVEGIRTDELHPFLKASGNYPMYRYINKTDLQCMDVDKFKFSFAGRPFGDEREGMPVDDDTNYVVMAQEIIQTCGKDFTPYDVAQAWMKYQGKDAYCTAERVAYCNFIKGFAPPQSAIYQNPYREWIGAQIRGDYFGYINPGNPQLAAEMAFRDASISHIKNGIYGEMFVSAMLAVAATTSNLEEIILGGLAEIPYTSRLYEDVMLVVDGFRAGATQKECFERIHTKYDEFTNDWCFTISNAMIVVASLLYGKGDYGKSICMSVETGFDTDCNAATVGSILGMANGVQSIPEYWKQPVNDILHTSIFGVGTVKISERAALTMEHIEKLSK